MKQKSSKKVKIRVIFSVIGLLIGLIGFAMYHGVWRPTPLSDRSYRTDGPHEYVSTGWIDFRPDEEAFTISFPDTPECTTKVFPIPRTKSTMSYKEFCSHGDDFTVSVGYVTVPGRLLKWGGNLVLKKALQIVLGHSKGAVLIGKGKNVFKSLPALDYEYYFDNRKKMGTLILAKEKLYRLEIDCPVSEKERGTRLLSQFIGSFDPV